MENQEYNRLKFSFDGALRKTVKENDLEETVGNMETALGFVGLFILAVTWYFFTWYYALLAMFSFGGLFYWMFEGDIKGPAVEAVQSFLNKVIEKDASVEKILALEKWSSTISFTSDDITQVFQEKIKEKVRELTKGNPDVPRIRREIEAAAEGGLAALPNVESTEPSSQAAKSENVESAKPSSKATKKGNGGGIPVGKLTANVTPSIPIYGNRAAIALSIEHKGLRIKINTSHRGLFADEPRRYNYLIPFHCIAKVERSDQIISSLVSAVFQPVTGTENRGYKITTHVPFNIYSGSSNNVTHWLSADVDGEQFFAPFEWLCNQSYPELPTCPGCNVPGLETEDATGFFASMSEDNIKVVGTCKSCSSKYDFNFTDGTFSPHVEA